MATPLNRRMRSAAGSAAGRLRYVPRRGGAGYVPPPPPHDPGPAPHPPHVPTPPPAVPTVGHAVLGVTNAQGYDPIRYGQHNQRIGYARVGQARNQGGAPAPQGGGGGAGGGGAATAYDGTRPPDALLGGRFQWGADNNKILDTQAGVYTPAQARQYQLLYNWAQQHGANIAGGGGTGGGYDPRILYAQPNRYVDMRTGLANPSSTGASADAGTFINQDVLARLQANSGFDPNVAAADAQRLGVTALGPGTNGQQYTNLGQDYVAPMATANAAPATNPATSGGTTPSTGAGGGGTANQPAPVSHTPQQALAAGRDPTKHLAYWHAQGWNMNPATGEWVQHGQNGGTTDPNGPQNQPNPTTQSQAGASNTLPINPQYDAAQTAATIQLNNALAQVNAGKGQLTADQALQQARLNTNMGVDEQKLLEEMAARGTLNSSIYGDNRGLLATDYGRQQQDLNIGVANALAALYGQQGDAQATYDQQILAALQDSAASTASDPNAPVAQYAGAGGGGNWTPTWKPKWKPPKKRTRHTGGN